MKSKAKTSIILSIFAICSVGCQKDGTVLADNSVVISPPQNESNLFGVPPHLTEAYTQEERQAMTRAQGEVLFRIDDRIGVSPYTYLFSPSVSLSDKDRLATSLIKSHQGDGGLLIRQVAAMSIVQEELEREDPNIARLGRYTLLLTEAENPSIDVITPSLTIMSELWSPVQLSRAASDALKGYDRYISNCGSDCSRGKGRFENGDVFLKSSDNSEMKRQAMKDALPVLKSLIQN